MPTPTPKLGIPKPNPNETVSLAAFHEIYDTIDTNAASQAELDGKFDASSGHKHTGQAGDAPPIPLDGIDPQARTSAGGTEANRLAVTNAAGRVGDAERVGGQTLANLDARYAPAAHVGAGGTAHATATPTTAGFMSASDKAKLDGIQAGAEVNQNAFSNVKVGASTIAADAKQDTLELAEGTGIVLTPDTTNDKVTIAVNATSPGGTEANRIAQTNASGRVGDSEKLGGAAASSYARKDTAETIAADWTIGDNNQRVLRRRSVELKIDTRTVVLTYGPDGKLLKVEEKDGATVVKTTNLTYDGSGRLSQVQEIAGGVTVTSTLNYGPDGKLASVSKAVS